MKPIVRETIIDLIEEYGTIDGEHHKQWLIDQIARIVLEDKYEEWIENNFIEYNVNHWDEGIAP